MIHLYGSGGVRIQNSAKTSSFDLPKAKCKVATKDLTIKKRNLDGLMLTSANKKYQQIITLEMVIMTESDRQSLINLLYMLSLSDYIYIYPAYNSALTDNYNLPVVLDEDIAPERIDDRLEIGETLTLTFNSLNTYSAIPLSNIAWEGYSSGIYDVGNYGS